MTTSTRTRTTPATVTPATVATVETPADSANYPAGDAPAITFESARQAADMLSHAVTMVSETSDDDKATRGTLHVVALSCYRLHALAMASVKEGVTVLPSNYAATVASLVWRDATGNPKSPAVKERTAGQKALGEYISKFSRVAQDETFGIDMLCSVRDMANASKAITDGAKADKERGALLAEAEADDEFRFWLSAIPNADSSTLYRAIDLLAQSSVSITHAAAFMRAVTRASKFTPASATDENGEPWS